MGEGFSGTTIKDRWTKPKVGRIEGGRWEWLGWGKWKGEMETTVLTQQYKKMSWWAMGFHFAVPSLQASGAHFMDKLVQETGA